jgi:hypothetical protein
MYFERWGLLAPPLKRQSLAFLINQSITHQQKGVQDGRSGVLACKKLSLFSTRHDDTVLIVLIIVLILLDLT